MTIISLRITQDSEGRMPSSPNPPPYLVGATSGSANRKREARAVGRNARVGNARR